jgi:hypothetical protein
MMKRTTVAADPHDLEILEYEARRRGVSLTRVLREAVAEYAAGVRTSRMPSFGIGHGGPNLSQETVDDELSPIIDQSGDRHD